MAFPGLRERAPARREGTPAGAWQPLQFEQALLRNMAQNQPATETAIGWLHSEYDSLNPNLTAAEWELGIPPVVVTIDKEVFLSFEKIAIGYFKAWVNMIAAREQISGKFSKIIIIFHPSLKELLFIYDNMNR